MSKEIEKTSPLTWIATIVVVSLVFLITKNLFEGKPYLLFESNADKRERIVTECLRRAFRRAKENLQAKVDILKEKTDPTLTDLENIEEYESVLNNNAVLREDSKYYYNECMEKYGY